MGANKKHLLKSYLFYLLIVLIFAGGLWATIYTGREFVMTDGSHAPTMATISTAFDHFMEGVYHHSTSSIGLLLLQIFIILVVARITGWLFTRMHQPAVIGEIVAGILLGPTLMGNVWPEGFAFLFPASSLGAIELLSQFGLILFMFAVGMELNLHDIKVRFTDSLVISHSSIFVPFLLSLPLSFVIYPELSAQYSTPFIPFVLFIGIAMSITAFPVLARIISEHGLNRLPLGKLSLSTAALGDISAWLFLAAIMAITQSGSISSSGFNLLLMFVYLLIMFGLIRPIFKVMGKIYDNSEVVSHTMIGIIFITLILSSYATEMLSMHALFGAFIMGLVMPEDQKFRNIITQKVEDVSLMLFLPLFFVSSGLQTQLGLISNGWMWGMLAIFTLVAVVGKVGGTYVAARATGHSEKDSLYLGAFMNTRGLMELVVLSIGLQLGVLPPPIYAVLVLMTIITTVMTQPLIGVINAFFKRKAKKNRYPHAIKNIYNGGKVLLSFGRPESGLLLLRLANDLLRRGERMPTVTALHITPDTDINPNQAEAIRTQCFAPLIAESEQMNLPLETTYEIASNIERAIVDELEEGYDLLMVGAGIRLSARASDMEANNYRRMLEKRLGRFSVATGEALFAMHSMLKDKMDFFVKHASCTVAVFVDRNYHTPNRILVLTDSLTDISLLPYARTIAENTGATLTIQPSHEGARIKETQLRTGETLLDDQPLPTPEILSQYDFMFVSYGYWKKLMAQKPNLLEAIPSTIILNVQSFANELKASKCKTLSTINKHETI